MNTQNQNQNQYQLPNYNQVNEQPNPESRWYCGCCRIHVECDKTETDWSKHWEEIVFALTGILALIGPVIAFIIWSFDQIGILKYRYSYEAPEIGFTHVASCFRPDVFLFTISPFMFITGITSIKLAMIHRWARQQNVHLTGRRINQEITMDDIVQMFAIVTSLVYVVVCLIFANVLSVNFNIPYGLDETTAYSSDGYLLQDRVGCAAYYYGHHFWSYFAVLYITMLPHTFTIIALCAYMCGLFLYGVWLLIFCDYKTCYTNKK